MNRAPTQHDASDTRRGMGVLLFVARALATSLEVVLHRPSTIGDRYLGAPALLALVLIFCWPVLCTPRDTTALYAYLAVYCLGLAAANGAKRRRRARGELGPHSYYTGTPLLMRALPKLRETTVKGAVEPVLAFGIGAVLVGPAPMLGGYLMTASIALMVTVQITLAGERRRVLDTHDAYLSQRHLVEQWRASQHENDWRDRP